jgi:nicotinamide-nucleotide amidase
MTFVANETQSEEMLQVTASLSGVLQRSGHSVAVAESLTSGSIASRLGAAEAASDWFCGGVVAYASSVKYKVLGVDPGPVVTASCARQMAQGVCDLTGSDLAVAITGVGGPDPVEGQPAGTVFIAAGGAGTFRVEQFQLPGGPEEVLRSATLAALRMLLEEAQAAGSAA